MTLIAQAFARTGAIADAYHLGSGPTAHSAPIWPVLAGLIYRLAGTGPLAEAILSAAALFFVGVSVILLNRVMARLGTPAAARLGAIAFVMLAPLNFEIEVVACRVWEQAIATAVIASVLWLVVRLDDDGEPLGWQVLAGLAAFAAPFTMISPAAALGAFGCIGILALRLRGATGFVLVTVLSAVLVAGVAYPWALRNERVVGEKIWSRSNFGFVFAEGFHASAVAPIDPRQVFVDRMAAIDPFERKAGYALLTAAGGEAAYSRAQTAATMTWVRSDPRGAAHIALRHAGEFFLPPRWHWHVYSDKSVGTAGKQAIVWAVALLGFGGVAWGLIRRDGRYLYVLAMLVLPVAPYILAQPILRYRYLITTLLVFLAADLLSRLAAVRISQAGMLRAAHR